MCCDPIRNTMHRLFIRKHGNDSTAAPQCLCCTRHVAWTRKTFPVRPFIESLLIEMVRKTRCDSHAETPTLSTFRLAASTYSLVPPILYH